MMKKDIASNIRILYIASFARSGSTILDTVLGNHPHMVGCGELIRLPTSGWLENEYCSCGKTVNQCEFWEGVYSRWCKATGSTPKEYIALQDRYERFRRIPILLKESRQNSYKFKRYAEQTVAMLRAIQDVSGCEVIVDSSKSPFRALALSRVEGVDVQIIHLVRDARAVAYSLARSHKQNSSAGIEKDFNGYSMIRTALWWNLFNTQISWVCKKIHHDNSLLMQYEHFTDDPVKALTELADGLQLDLDPLISKFENEEAFEIEHIVAGNRLRMNKEVRLKKDTEWQNALSQTEQRSVKVLTRFLLKRYGFLS